MSNNGQTRKQDSHQHAVPVLMYHSVIDEPAHLPVGQSFAYSVLKSSFESQLRLIKSANFDVIPLSQLANGEVLASSTVITFDDGCETDYSTALPALQQFGFTATFFISTANVGTQGYLDWGRVREMHKAGMTFGSHAHQHIPLTPLSLSDARDQLRRSKDMLEDATGTAVTALSAPFGFLNKQIVSIARDLGYVSICSSVPKMARSGDRVVPRVAIRNSTTLTTFERVLRGDWRTYFPSQLRTAISYVPRHVLLYLRPDSPGIRELKANA